LRAQIAALPALLGVPMILVTHDQSEAMTLGHRLAILRDGVLQQMDRPPEVYRAPANLFVAGFLGSPPMNFLPGELAEESGVLIWRGRSRGTGEGAGELRLVVPSEKAGAWRNFVGREILAGLRPEHLEVLAGGANSTDGVIPATVRAVELLGPETSVRVEYAGLELTARAPASFEGVAGERVGLQIDPQAARFFDRASGCALA
jgi:multiple sugar transport system ATP-binding protein